MGYGQSILSNFSLMTSHLPRVQRTFLILVIPVVSVAAPLRADVLRPDELLLIYNGSAPASGELASHYARMRGVPGGRLLAVQVDAQKEEISAAHFERLIRQPVRKYLEEQKLRERVRCLVTFYGVPIRVGKQRSTPEQKRLLDTWRKQLISALDELERATGELEAIGKDEAPPLSARVPTEDDYQSLRERYGKARVAAWERIKGLPDADAAGEQREKFFAVLQKVQGVGALVAQLQLARATPPEEARKRLQEIQRGVRQAEARVNQILARGLQDPGRDEARKLIRRFAGLLGLLANLQNDMSRIRPDQTHAAVDSELALLWWDGYVKYRWVPNTLNWRLRTDPERRRQVPAAYWNLPVLMVSRIDAPTPLIARQMIDRAIAAERGGLTGRVYVDARGLKPGKGHGQYDQNLRELAQMLWDHTDLTVRLDNRPELFGPGRCPETMLYCGWYSLRKYVDAFDFVPGAVGYHIASFEAASLRNPGEQGWCKRMLEDGITATMGPVAEPYLHSFPLPEDFFGLLLTGRFTLAECYAYTVPLNSWMQMLLGDPLYRPFARRGLLTLEQVYEPEHIPAGFKSAPGSQPAESRRGISRSPN